MRNETRGIQGKEPMNQSPRWVHPPDELGVLVVVVHPRRRRRHESHGSRALTRINSFRHAAKTKSDRRAGKLLLPRRAGLGRTSRARRLSWSWRPDSGGDDSTLRTDRVVTLMRCSSQTCLPGSLDIIYI